MWRECENSLREQHLFFEENIKLPTQFQEIPRILIKIRVQRNIILRSEIKRELVKLIFINVSKNYKCVESILKSMNICV